MGGGLRAAGPPFWRGETCLRVSGALGAPSIVSAGVEHGRGGSMRTKGRLHRLGPRPAVGLVLLVGLVAAIVVASAGAAVIRGTSRGDTLRGYHRGRQALRQRRQRQALRPRRQRLPERRGRKRRSLRRARCGRSGVWARPRHRARRLRRQGRGGLRDGAGAAEARALDRRRLAGRGPTRAPSR